jgi:ABC-type transport system involved in multi-copper enzyme maturation permease subunit
VPPGSFGGPVFAFELVRLARGGRLARLRTLYGLALLAALLVTYVARFPGTVTWESAFRGGPLVKTWEAAEFAQAFVDTTLIMQFAAGLLLTPAAVAGAVAEERQRQTLDALRTTALDDFAIVTGKWAAHVAHLGGVLLIGLPVLSLMQLFGGVDLGRLVAAFVVTVATLASTAALSLWSSARGNPLRATFTAYATTVGAGVATLVPQCVLFPVMSHLGSLNPVLMMYLVIDGPDAEVGLYFPILGAAFYGLCHGLVAWWMLASAARALPNEPPATDLSPFPDAPDRTLVVPPLDEGRPLVWKERYFGAGIVLAELTRAAVVGAGFILAWMVAYLALFALLAASGVPQPLIRLGSESGPLLAAMTIVVLGGSCLTAALFTAGSVSREREARTLDGLLSLPGDWSDVLGAKWWASLWRVRGPLYFLAGVWAFGVVTSALHPLAVPLLIVTATAHLSCATSLGLYLSVVARGTGRAVTLAGLLALLPTAFVLLPGPLTALAPPAAWWLVAFPTAATTGEPMAAVLIAAIDTGLYAFTGWALYRAAVRRFARESEPPVVSPRAGP